MKPLPPSPALATLTLAELRAVSGGADPAADLLALAASFVTPDPPSKPPPKLAESIVMPDPPSKPPPK